MEPALTTETLNSTLAELEANQPGIKLIGERARQSDSDSDARIKVLEEIAVARGIRIGVVDVNYARTTPDQMLERHSNEQVDVIVVLNGVERRSEYFPEVSFMENGDLVFLQQVPYEEFLNGTEYPVYEANESVEDGVGIGATLKLGIYGERVVFVPWRIHSSYTDDDQLRIVSKLLDRVIQESMEDNLMDAVREAQRAALAESLSTTLRDRHTGRLEELRRQMNTAVSDLQTYRNSVGQQETAIAQLKPQIEAIKQATINDDDITPEALGKVIEDIYALPHVVGVTSPENGRLTIKTDSLMMAVDYFDGTSYEATAGKYGLILDFVNMSITVNNLTNRHGLYDHPHISSGDFCLGNQRDLVYSLMKDAQFAPAIGVLIDFLQVVNPDDCYYDGWREWFPDINDDEEPSDYDE